MRQDVLILQKKYETDRLDQSQRSGEEARILREFHAAGLALFMHEGFPLREHHSEELDDDGRSDERSHAQHDDGKVGKATAGKDVQEAEELAGREQFGQIGGIDTGDRDGRQNAENDESGYGEADPFA